MNRIVIVLCMAFGSSVCFASDVLNLTAEPLIGKSDIASYLQALRFFLKNSEPYKDSELIEKYLAQIDQIKCVIPEGTSKRYKLIIKLFGAVLAFKDPGIPLALQETVNYFKRNPRFLGALLSTAVIYDNYCAFSCLVNEKADLYVQSRKGVTPMSLAVASKRLKMLSCLRKQRRAFCSPGDSMEYSPIVVAAFNGFADILYDILMHESLEPSLLMLALVNAVVGQKRGCIEMLTKHLLALDLGPSAVLADPLFAAARKGYVAGVRYFLKQGTSPNVFVGSKNITPLWAAVDSGDVDTVKALWEAGANPDLYACPEHSFWKALIDKGSLKVLSFVLEKKPDISSVLVMGEPIVEYTQKHGSDEVKTALSEYARSKTPCV